ncbi:hypothetical protein AB0G20_21290 [Streptomyces sp. NPDC024017]|uniref:hypothetical protein n=1 Tax=Streptomyces sp. NPDC024017 TaxID=3154326 RepID=UPI00340366F4
MSKRGAAMALFAKFVRPGHVRIAVTSNPQSNVYTSAYKGSGSRVVVVAVDNGTSSVTQQFTLQNNPSSGVSSWVTDGGRNLASQARINVSNGSFTAQLPAQSLPTFMTG